MKKTTSTVQSQSDETKSQVSEAVEAALDKKAQDIVVLDVKEVSSFTDNFIICTGTSSRHNQTIADGIEEVPQEPGNAATAH